MVNHYGIVNWSGYDACLSDGVNHFLYFYEDSNANTSGWCVLC